MANARKDDGLEKLFKCLSEFDLTIQEMQEIANHFPNYVKSELNKGISGIKFSDLKKLI